MNVPNEVTRLVETGKSFLITCHIAPDADAVGSMLAFGEILKALGKDVTLFSSDRVPDALAFLSDPYEIVSAVSDTDHYDGTFIVDTAARDLLPKDFPAAEVTGPLVTIDHHGMFQRFADYDVRDVNAASTGMILITLAPLLGVRALPPASANALYASILADTAGFRLPSTNAALLRAAADLIDLGAEPAKVARHVFEEWPYERLMLLREALESIQLHFDGKFALMTVSKKMIEAVGATSEMTEGFVNYGRRLKGVKVAGLLWEKTERDLVKLSLRSSLEFDAAMAARRLGGGGHRCAAGAALRKPLQEAKHLVVESVGAQMGHRAAVEFSNACRDGVQG